MPSVPPASVQSLLDALSATLGDTFTLDEDGQCSLVFDDDVDVAIALTPSSDLLTIRASVVRHASEVTAGMIRRALEMNYGQLPPGLSIALDAASGYLLLMAVLEPEATTPGHFQELLAAIVAWVPEIRRQLVSAQVIRDGAFHTGEI